MSALPSVIQYVVAEIPSSRSLRSVRTACGRVRRLDRRAPDQARMAMIIGVTSFGSRSDRLLVGIGGDR